MKKKRRLPLMERTGTECEKFIVFAHSQQNSMFVYLKRRIKYLARWKFLFYCKFYNISCCLRIKEETKLVSDKKETTSMSFA